MYPNGFAVRLKKTFEKVAMAPSLLLIDRDGTLIQKSEVSRYLFGDASFSLMEGAAECLRHLQDREVIIAVCTNQQGVSLKEFPDMTLSAVQRFHERLNEHLKMLEIHPLRFFVCPHSETLKCSCRKPAPGLLHEAMQAYRVDPDKTWFVGDSISDVVAAQRAGVQSILLFGTSEKIATGVVSVGSWRSLGRLQAFVVENARISCFEQIDTQWTTTNRAAYDEVVESYVLRTARFALGEQEFIMRLYQSYLRGTEQGLVIDYGCGPARDGSIYMGIGWMYLGVDNSQMMLRAAGRELSQFRNGDWAIVNSDMGSLNLPRESASLIVFNSSIQHIERSKLDLVLERVVSLLRWGGCLYIHFRVGEGERLEWSYEYSTDGICRFNTYFQAEEIASALVKKGMKIAFEERYTTDYEIDDVRKKLQVPLMCRIVAIKD